VNSQEALILFIAVVVVASLAVYTLNNEFQLALSRASTVSTVAARQSSTALEILSVYGDANETNVVIKGIIGVIDVNSLTVFVDGVPYVGKGVFVRDGDGDGVLDPGDVYIISLQVPADPEKNCVRVVSPNALDIMGQCFQ